MKKNKRGFTLIEVLVAASIIAILATIGMVSYQAAGRNGRDAKRKSDLEQLRSALEIYKSDNSVYSITTSCVASDLLLNKYINPYPTDPASNKYQYCYIQQAALKAYILCAYLENGGNSNIAACSSQCGSGGKPGVCNYSVTNP